MAGLIKGDSYSFHLAVNRRLSRTEEQVYSTLQDAPKPPRARSKNAAYTKVRMVDVAEDTREETDSKIPCMYALLE